MKNQGIASGDGFDAALLFIILFFGKKFFSPARICYSQTYYIQKTKKHPLPTPSAADCKGVV